MSYKEQLVKLTDINASIDSAESLLRDLKAQKSALQLELIAGMRADGVDKVRSDTHQAYITRKKDYAVVNPIAFSSEFVKRKVPIQNYMVQNTTMMKTIAKEWVKEGNAVAGFEQKESEYLTLKPLKEDENNQAK